MVKENKYQWLILTGMLLLLGLWATSLYSYLLFHSLAELFSIAVACAIFILAWNTRRFLDNSYLLFIGIAYLFVGSLDLLHTLGYTGMGVFPGYNTNLPTQLWISARYLEALSLLIGCFFLGRQVRMNLVVSAYGVATALLLGSIFYWDVFPTCFVEGVGLTPFKKIGEYVISIILLASTGMLHRKRAAFDPGVLRLLIASILVTIGSELAFTLYMHAYGFPNLVGHYLKIVSFYLIYKAIVETGLRRPYALLFRDLKRSENDLRAAKENLELQVNMRTAELTQTNEALRRENIERKKAEEELRLFKTIIESSKEAVAISDPEGGLIYINPAHEQLFGRSLEEAKQCNYRDCYPPESVKILNEKVAPALSRGESWEGELEVLDAQGRLFPLWERADTVRDETGNMLYGFGFTHDITERKQAEEKLKASEQRLSGIIHSISDHMSMMDKDLNIVWANEVAKQLFGPDILGRKCHWCYHKRKEACESCLVKKTFQDGRIHNHITEVIDKDGNTRVFWFTSSVAADNEQGKPRLVIEISRDITTQKRAEEKIRESEEKYRALVEQAQNGITILQDGKIRFVNPYLATLQGYTVEELLNTSFSEHIPPEELPRITDIYQRRMNKEPVPSVCESVIQSKDGSRIEVEFNAGLTQYNGEPADLVIVRDITERKQAEQKLQDYQRRLKALASQLTIAEERERRRIAAELHDLIGHSLALARVQLDAVPAASSKTEATLLIKDISRILLKAIQDTKNLIFELSSPSMNEIGLGAAISELLEEQIEKRYRLETEFIDNIDDSHGKVLDKNTRAILFRNVRELFINVIKHAQASKVSVFMDAADAVFKIVVKDDGIGFNPEDVYRGANQEVKFGLFSIQERMIDLGGSLEIISEPGKGSKVIMTGPLNTGRE